MCNFKDMNNLDRLFNEKKDKVKKLGITLNNPATLEELEKLELKLNRKLPSDLINFYKFCNGFETDDYLFRVIPIQEIIDYKSELNDNIFHFAEYLIYSDQWLIQLNDLEQYEIINDNHKSQKNMVQANSIVKFLETYLDGGLFSEVENNSFWDRLNKNYT